MSDHFSGPRALAEPAIDITDLYAFPHPRDAGRLVLVMNVFPVAAPSALFSDAVEYRFRVRSAGITATGPEASFAVGDDERLFRCAFAAPQQREDGQLVQEGTCLTPSGEVVSFVVNDELGGQSAGVRVFGGVRLDPFFIDVAWLQRALSTGQLTRPAEGTNTLAGQNVLSLVVEVELAAFLEAGQGPLLAVAGETATRGALSARLERIGRPEMKNVVLGLKNVDKVNRDLEIRDLYNSEDAFRLAPDYLGAYRARVDANLAFYDHLDGDIAWPASGQGGHPLTELLLADFLVVDVSKPHHETSYLEIEQALLRGEEPQTCGGRWLDDDIIDTLLTLLINGGGGPRISDGVDEPTRKAAHAFPFLAPPNPTPGEFSFPSAPPRTQ
ncbi:DUF4331 family protein [Streptomyces sp. NPDC028722]|uniref:DUF4331 family protein n=1 Tax=Streptomyces sp. NPDC028722 TaxID=3155016 RepID=UPI0034039622